MSFGMVATSYLAVIDETPTPRLAFAFDEGGGYEFSPTIGTAVGTVAPAYAAWEQGVHGSALGRWMGGDNSLMVEASTNLDSSAWTQLTVMAWVMPLNFGAEQFLLLCESSSQEVFGLVFSASSGGTGAVLAYVRDTSLGWSADNTVQPGAEEFVHIACTWDGSIIRLYVNGEEVSSGARTTPLDDIEHITIGSAPWTTDGGFVDDLRIYDTALSQAQIANLMTVPVE